MNIIKLYLGRGSNVIWELVTNNVLYKIMNLNINLGEFDTSVVCFSGERLLGITDNIADGISSLECGVDGVDG